MMRTLLPLAVAAGCLSMAPAAENPRARVRVAVDERGAKISPRVFGHFTEESLTSYENGVSSEMLYNRKFEVQEQRSETDNWLTGAADGWEPLVLDGNVTLVVDRDDYYSPSYSERITCHGMGSPAGLQQSGWAQVFGRPRGVRRTPMPFHFRQGKRYKVRLSLKSRDFNGSVHVALGRDWRSPAAHGSVALPAGSGWRTVQLELTSTADVPDGRFMVYVTEPGTFWLDSASLVEADLDDGGFRRDVVAITRTMTPTLIRWPGGWFVSDYHWQDGIGPVDQRPARFGRLWENYYNNDIGIDEFLALCAKLGAEPYLAVNVGTGSAEEAAALVEYVNGAADSRGGKIRAQNGHPEPYKVRLWNIGNEEYLPTLGGSPAAAYRKTYLEYAKAMRRVDPSIELVAVGSLEIPAAAAPPSSPDYRFLRYALDWGRQFLPEAASAVDFYAVHYYDPGDSVHENHPVVEWDRMAMVASADLSVKLRGVEQVMQETGKHLPLAIDEWAISIPARLRGGVEAPQGSRYAADPHGSQGPWGTMREALGEAGVYNLFQRRADLFGLANHTLLWARGHGMVGISRDGFALSPSALVSELYSTRETCFAVKAQAEGPVFTVPQAEGFTGAEADPVLDVSARIHPDGKTVDLFLVNRSLDDALDTAVEITGARSPGSAGVAVISGGIHARNTFERPDLVRIQSREVQFENGTARLLIAAHTVMRVRVVIER